MLSTSRVYFSYQWLRYTWRLWQARDSLALEDMVYILADENGNMDPHKLRGKATTPLFAHSGASSRHGWDAAAIVWISRHYGKVCALSCWSFVAIALLVLRTLCRSSKEGALRGEDDTSLSRDEERLLEGKEG